jgi:Holliday junction resolvase RusA-like endonuclease
MKLEFFMPMQPPQTTAQQQRILKSGRVVKGDKVSNAIAKLEAHLYTHRPAQPIDGPISLTAFWQWKGKEGWKITRPDTDNLVKALKDAMTRLGYWNDDAQVCDERICKCWGEVPGIYVKVESLEE